MRRVLGYGPWKSRWKLAWAKIGSRWWPPSSSMPVYHHVAVLMNFDLLSSELLYAFIKGHWHFIIVASSWMMLVYVILCLTISVFLNLCVLMIEWMYWLCYSARSDLGYLQRGGNSSTNQRPGNGRNSGEGEQRLIRPGEANAFAHQICFESDQFVSISTKTAQNQRLGNSWNVVERDHLLINPE